MKVEEKNVEALSCRRQHSSCEAAVSFASEVWAQILIAIYWL
jgi:hypothetical protein